MALTLGPDNFLSLGGWSGPGHIPSTDPGSHSVLRARNASTVRNNTVNLFVDSYDKEYEYAASVVSACGDKTTLALQCTTAPARVNPYSCGPGAGSLTVTVGPSTYEFSIATSVSTPGDTMAATRQVTCVLAGTTAAACAETVSAMTDGTATQWTANRTLSGGNYYRYDVELTAGAEKTASQAAICGVRGAAVAASLENKKVALWALVAVVGVGSVLVL